MRDHPHCYRTQSSLCTDHCAGVLSLICIQWLPSPSSKLFAVFQTQLVCSKELK